MSGIDPVPASQLEKAKGRAQANVLALMPAIALVVLIPLPTLALAMMLLSHPLAQPSFASSLMPEDPTASRPSPD